MAPESCNLGKDEAEILKPSSPASASSSSSPSASSPPPSKPSCFLLDPPLIFQAQRSVIAASLPKLDKESRPPALYVIRCSTCHKRIGLTGFRCRCGDLFCARHRYSDTHDCSYDYKAAGREEISKANPVIRAAKIIKI